MQELFYINYNSLGNALLDMEKPATLYSTYKEVTLKEDNRYLVILYFVDNVFSYKVIRENFRNKKEIDDFFCRNIGRLLDSNFYKNVTVKIPSDVAEVEKESNIYQTKNGVKVKGFSKKDSTANMCIKILDCVTSDLINVSENEHITSVSCHVRKILKKFIKNYNDTYKTTDNIAANMDTIKEGVKLEGSYKSTSKDNGNNKKKSKKVKGILDSAESKEFDYTNADNVTGLPDTSEETTNQPDTSEKTTSQLDTSKESSQLDGTEKATNRLEIIYTNSDLPKLVKDACKEATTFSEEHFKESTTFSKEASKKETISERMGKGCTGPEDTKTYKATSDIPFVKICSTPEEIAETKAALSAYDEYYYGVEDKSSDSAQSEVTNTTTSSQSEERLTFVKKCTLLLQENAKEAIKAMDAFKRLIKFHSPKEEDVIKDMNNPDKDFHCLNNNDKYTYDCPNRQDTRACGCNNKKGERICGYPYRQDTRACGCLPLNNEEHNRTTIAEPKRVSTILGDSEESSIIKVLECRGKLVQISENCNVPLNFVLVAAELSPDNTTQLLLELQQMVKENEWYLNNKLEGRVNFLKDSHENMRQVLYPEDRQYSELSKCLVHRFNSYTSLTFPQVLEVLCVTPMQYELILRGELTFTGMAIKYLREEAVHYVEYLSKKGR